MGVLAALLVFTLVFGGGLISQDRTAIAITGLVGAVVGGFVVLTYIPGVIAGMGLLQFNNWARVLALVLGILNLPGIPLGTILGVYTLWALLDDESAELFTAAG